MKMTIPGLKSVWNQTADRRSRQNDVSNGGLTSPLAAKCRSTSIRRKQAVHILSGRMKLIVNGTPHELTTGDTFYLASGVSAWRLKPWKRRGCSTPLVRRGTNIWP